MNVSSERSRSLWISTASLVEASVLQKDGHADAVVVGAGIAGISTAYELAKAGKSVIVLDRGPIGGGMTARTTGHLASELDDYYHEFIKRRGLDGARQVYGLQSAAIDRIEAIVCEESIECDFKRVDGYLFLGSGTDPSILQMEFEAAREVGQDVAWAERAPVPGRDTGRCLRFPEQGRFHPLKYINGLVRCIKERGGQIYTETTVNDVAAQDDGSVLITTASGKTIGTHTCVVATNSPINEIDVHSKQAPYRTYAIAGRLSVDSVDDALFWDTLDPYHYVRLQPNGDGSAWLISGGEDHKSGEATDMEERFRRLETWTREHFPSLGEVDHRWSGQVLEPVDYAAFIGPSSTGPNIYMVTGDSGQGLTNGVGASLIISSLALGRESPFAPAHDPQRSTRGAVKEFVSENVTVVTDLVEKLMPGDVGSVDEIPPGEGAIVRKGLSKIAAYRDEGGLLHVRSASCTHAGCVVQWNPFEKCWDCPCHGSHFLPDGTAINGPAVDPLSPEDPRERGCLVSTAASVRRVTLSTCRLNGHTRRSKFSIWDRRVLQCRTLLASDNSKRPASASDNGEERSALSAGCRLRSAHVACRRALVAEH